ncbi:MAG: hypothetical protein V2I27_00660, partial [Erythrobacter sp.]|nr:hypothetical protein [Erythrobacter sp.]
SCANARLAKATRPTIPMDDRQNLLLLQNTLDRSCVMDSFVGDWKTLWTRHFDGHRVDAEVQGRKKSVVPEA